MTGFVRFSVFTAENRSLSWKRKNEIDGCCKPRFTAQCERWSKLESMEIRKGELHEVKKYRWISIFVSITFRGTTAYCILFPVGFTSTCQFKCFRFSKNFTLPSVRNVSYTWFCCLWQHVFGSSMVVIKSSVWLSTISVEAFQTTTVFSVYRALLTKVWPLRGKLW